MKIEQVSSLAAAFATMQLTDIYVTGFLADDDVIHARLRPPSTTRALRFHPRHDHVFLELGNESLFLIECANPYGEMVVTAVDRIDQRFEIDEDWQFGYAGIMSMILENRMDSVNVHSIEAFTAKDADGTVRLVSIGLVSSQNYLFFEGWNHEGIGPGGSVARNAWVEWVKDKVESVTIHVLGKSKG